MARSGIVVAQSADKAMSTKKDATAMLCDIITFSYIFVFPCPSTTALIISESGLRRLSAAIKNELIFFVFVDART